METSSPITSTTTRSVAFAAPALLALYGVARYADGLDGDHGPGLFWNVGHVAFLLAVAGFTVLAVQLARDGLRRPGRPLGWVCAIALTTTAVGAALMCWIILTDLGVPVADVPGAVVTGAPIAFGVGLVALLATQVGRGIPLWSPLAILAGNVALGIDLALLTPAGLVMLAALWPLIRPASPLRRHR